MIPRGVVVWACCTIASCLTTAHAMSFQEERDLGARFELSARQQLRFISDPEVTQYVQRIGERIVATLPERKFDYRWNVVANGQANAFAVPGGLIYINGGLILHAASDDELAGVLAHEVAHVELRHMARQQERAEILNYATLLGMLASVIHPAAGALASGASTAVQLRYRREFEQESDFAGVRYLQAAGLNPHGLSAFFRRLAEQERLASPDAVPPYLLTHPLTDDRLNRIDAVLRTLHTPPKEQRPASDALREAQARVRVRTMSPADAVVHYQREARANPSDPLSDYLLGIVLFETGQMSEAEVALKRAKATGVTAATRELGRLALRRRDGATARKLLESFSEQNPGDAGALADLGQAIEIQGASNQAIEKYRQALAVDPDLEGVHRALGQLIGRTESEAEGLYHLATAHWLHGEYSAALSQYERASAGLPEGGTMRSTATERAAALRDFLGLPIPSAPIERDAETGQD